MSYQIAIPSYKRSKKLRDSTLSLLQKHAFPVERIDVFVADEAERAEYASVLVEGTYANIIVGVPGMGAIRNFMTDYYPEGHYILYMDDDITDFLMLSDYKYDIYHVFRQAFEDCVAEGVGLFGCYPVANRFFMRPVTTLDLRYIIGSVYGCVNDRSIQVSLDDGEDKERTCLSYLKYGGVMRMNWISPKTKYYKTAGGMQITRTLDRQRASGLKLLEQFPMLLSRIDKKDGRIEHRFRDKRLKSDTADT